MKKKIEKIDRDIIQKAEGVAKLKFTSDLSIYAHVSGTALNLIMDKLDEIIDVLNSSKKK